MLRDMKDLHTLLRDQTSIMALICHHGIVMDGKCSVVSRDSAFMGYHPSSSCLLSPVWVPMQVILTLDRTWAKWPSSSSYKTSFLYDSSYFTKLFLVPPKEETPVQKNKQTNKVTPQGQSAGQWWSRHRSPHLPTALGPVTHTASLPPPKQFVSLGTEKRNCLLPRGPALDPLSSACPLRVPQGRDLRELGPGSRFWFLNPDL